MCKSGLLGCAHFAMKLIEAEGLRNLFTRLVGRAVMLVVNCQHCTPAVSAWVARFRRRRQCAF
jgi:hypothetical protein